MLPWSTKAVICNLDLHFVPEKDKPDGPVLEICVARKTGKQTHRLVAKLGYLASSCSWVDESSVPRMDVATADARVHLASLAVAITPTGALVATLVATSDLKPFRSEICIPVRMKPTGVPAPSPVPDVPDVPVSAPDAPEPSPVPVDDGQTEPGAPDEEMDLDGESGGRKRTLDTVETPEKPEPPVKKHRQSRHQSEGKGEGQSLDQGADHFFSGRCGRAAFGQRRGLRIYMEGQSHRNVFAEAEAKGIGGDARLHLSRKADRAFWPVK